MAISYRRFRTTYQSHLQVSEIQKESKNSLPLKMGLMGCPESSVRNCQHSLHKPEERSSSSLFSFTTATGGTQKFLNVSSLLERCVSLFIQLLGAIRILIFSHCFLIKWVNSFLITLLFLLPHRTLSFANPVPTILIIKANEMHYFSYLFDKVLYMFRTCPLSIIMSISTLYTRNRFLSC